MLQSQGIFIIITIIIKFCRFYAIAAPIVGFLTTKISKEKLTLFAFLLSALALLIQGPSRLLGFSNNMTMTVVGFIFLGSMEAFIFVPLMPVIIDALGEEPSLAQMGEEVLSDQASSLFQSAQAVGCILGPIIGGFLNDIVRFQSTCDFMAMTCLVYAGVLYWFMMGGREKVGKQIKQALNNKKDEGRVLPMVIAASESIEMSLIGGSSALQGGEVKGRKAVQRI